MRGFEDQIFLLNCLIGVKCAVVKQDEKVKPPNEVKVTPRTESFWKATHFISFMEPGIATKVTSSGFICTVLNVKHPGGVSVSSARSTLFPECNLCGEKMMPLTAIVCNSAIPLLRCVFLSRPLSCSASLISSPYLKSWSRRGFIVFSKGIRGDRLWKGLCALLPFHHPGPFVILRRFAGGLSQHV